METAEIKAVRHKIYLIAGAVMLWAFICAFIVKSAYGNIGALTIPIEFPPLFIYDLMWLIAYVCFLVGIQLGALAGLRNKKAWILVGIMTVLGLSQILMYYFFFIMLNLNLAFAANTINIIAALSVAVFLWPLSRVGSVFTVPYTALTSFSLYVLILTIQVNA